MHTPDLPILEPHLDPVRMRSRRGQDVFHDTDRQLARPLILFQHDRHTQPWTYRFPAPAIHRFLFSAESLLENVVVEPSRG
jgi:hypothetical protein